MLLSLVYFVIRQLLHAVAPLDRRSDLEREAELLVLPSAQGALEGRAPAAVPQARPNAPRRGESDPAKGAVEGVRGDPSDPAPVAPGAIVRRKNFA